MFFFGTSYAIAQCGHGTANKEDIMDSFIATLFVLNTNLKAFQYLLKRESSRFGFDGVKIVEIEKTEEKTLVGILSTDSVAAPISGNGSEYHLGWYIEHLENEQKMIRSYCGEELGERVKDITPGRCDVCGRKIARKKTYVLIDEKGEITAVGGSCVKNFHGHNLKEMAEKINAKFDRILREAEESGVVMGGGLRTLGYMLGLYEAIIERHGFVSKTKAEEKGIESTVNLADYAYSSFTKYKAEDYKDVIEHAWSRCEHFDSDGYEEYERLVDKFSNPGCYFHNNCMAILRSRNTEKEGLIAYIASLKYKVEYTKKQAFRSLDTDEGEKVELDGMTVSSIREKVDNWSRYYGVVATTGEYKVYFKVRSLEKLNKIKGRTFKLKATVSGHGRGITFLNRPSFC